jgi:RHS repeat-associated protein
MLKKLGSVLFAVATFFSVGVSAQEVTLAQEFGEKIRAAQVQAPLQADAFGNSINDATGQTVFSNVDIDLPGNSALPVRLGRRLPIEPRYIQEELGGLGNWDIDVPYIEATFSRTYGWSISVSTDPNRFRRCTYASPPVVEGALFSSEEVFHGYRVHIPGVLDDLMMANANNHPNPTDGKSYPWVVGAQARVSCLPSIKNGQAGEGFVVHLPDGVRYRFDFPVERTAPTLRKGPKYIPGYTMPRKRIFMLATRIEDRFGNHVDLQYGSTGQLLSVTANDGRQITLQPVVNGYVATANGRQWQYQIQSGYLTAVINPDGSRWTYSPFGTYSPRVDTPDDTLALDYFSPESFCQANQQYPDYMGTASFSVTHPGGARATFDFAGHVFGRSRVQYMCVIDFFDHQVQRGNWMLTMMYRDRAFSDAVREWVRCIANGTTREQQNGCGSISDYYVEYQPINEEGTEDVSGYARILVPNTFPSMALTRMEVTGAGLSPLVTQYSYQHQQFGYCDLYDHQTGLPSGPRCSEDPCADGSCTDSVGRWTDITLPGGDRVRKRFGVVYGVNEGLLLEEQILDAQGRLMRHVVYRYIDGADTSAQPFNRRVGYSHTPDPMQGMLMPLVSTEVRQSGDSFVSEVSAFDALGRPVRVLKTNNLGRGTHKFDVVEYHDDLALWVIGQRRREYTEGSAPNGRSSTGGSMVVSEVVYNAQAMPLRTYRFGKLQNSYEYWPDGNVKTVFDGRNNATHYSDYHRGIPRLIRHPATAEAPEGATESATVDNNGWITSVTNEVGAVTGYGYDAMGRVASVVHPTGDPIAAPFAGTGNYFNTLRHFRALTESDWKPAGVANGQWRLYEETGNLVTVTYMDALWRPILRHEYDATNIGPTLRAFKTGYDAGGRVAFQSYPSSEVIPPDVGTSTFYDALDRVIRVEQHSELSGPLTTTTEYLSGLRTRVTNARGHVAINAFTAWDQPTYDFPISSVQPEGKVVSVERHPQFGWPLAMTQRDASHTTSVVRRFVYDGNARLCKSIEPETGVTVSGYDEAGNPAWEARGLDIETFGSLSDCQHVAAYGAGRTTTRTYDARNRLTHLNFPNGGVGNQIWTYEKDGLPASVTTYNDVNGAAPVITGYVYNKRRLLTGETLSQPGWYTWSTGYAYDGYGHLSAQTYPTGLTIDYAPNPLGQATRAGSFASGALYHPNGALKQFTYGNGIVHTMQQNVRQLPERVVSSGGVLDYYHVYDRNGNVEHIANNLVPGYDPRDRWMEYDALDRLTAVGSASFGGDHWHRMTYDALDNLKSWKLQGVKDYAEYIYDARNRLTSIRNGAAATVVGLEYDLQGNLYNKNGLIHRFDFGNRLRSVDGKEAYRYDGLGRRVLSWRWPTPTMPQGSLALSMYSQAGQLLYEEDHHAAPMVAKEHIYLAGSVIATRENKWGVSLEVKYQHTDALGSPVAVTNASGQVIERLDYEPWGAIIGKPAHNGIGFTGHVMDGATGLTYMQQRYYDPSLGRFLSVDPVTAYGGDWRYFNRYHYAAGNPYKYVDPDGRQSRRREESFALFGTFLAELFGVIDSETADAQRVGITDGAYKPPRKGRSGPAGSRSNGSSQPVSPGQTGTYGDLKDQKGGMAKPRRWIWITSRLSPLKSGRWRRGSAAL